MNPLESASPRYAVPIESQGYASFLVRLWDLPDSLSDANQSSPNNDGWRQDQSEPTVNEDAAEHRRHSQVPPLADEPSERVAHRFESYNPNPQRFGYAIGEVEHIQSGQCWPVYSLDELYALLSRYRTIEV